jgi:hypothetical protein
MQKKTARGHIGLSQWQKNSSQAEMEKYVY